MLVICMNFLAITVFNQGVFRLHGLVIDENSHNQPGYAVYINTQESCLYRQRLMVLNLKPNGAKPERAHHIIYIT